MARTIVVLCDVHFEKGQRVEAKELPPITVEGKQPRVLALCAEHKRDYYDPFVELVEDLGLAISRETSSKAIPDEDSSSKLGAGQTAGGETGQGVPDAGEDSQQEDPAQVVEESPTMTAASDDPETARWDCPVDGCDKSYSASGEHRAEDLKRLGNLHLSTSHNLNKAARLELLSA